MLKMFSIHIVFVQSKSLLGSDSSVLFSPPSIVKETLPEEMPMNQSFAVPNSPPKSKVAVWFFILPASSSLHESFYLFSFLFYLSLSLFLTLHHHRTDIYFKFCTKIVQRKCKLPHACQQLFSIKTTSKLQPLVSKVSY